MYNDYTGLTEEELDEKINSIQAKMSIAYQQGQEGLVEQLRFHLDNLNLELMERMERARFEIISERTPESYIIGEDPDDEDADED